MGKKRTGALFYKKVAGVLFLLLPDPFSSSLMLSQWGWLFLGGERGKKAGWKNGRTKRREEAQPALYRYSRAYSRYKSRGLSGKAKRFAACLLACMLLEATPHNNDNIGRIGCICKPGGNKKKPSSLSCLTVIQLLDLVTRECGGELFNNKLILLQSIELLNDDGDANYIKLLSM